MATLLFLGKFTASKTGKTGLTVTLDIDAYAYSDGTRTSTATGVSATEGRNGIYSYRLTNADPTNYKYVATFKTSDSSVDDQQPSGIEFVLPDALISSRLAPATAGRTVDVDAAGKVTAANVLTAQQARDALALALTPETPVGEGSIDYALLVANMTLAEIAEDTGTTLPALIAAIQSITAQEVRDAMKLAPSAGAPATGSVDDLLEQAGGGNVTVQASVALTAAQADAIMGGKLALVTYHTYSVTLNSDSQADLTAGEIVFALKSDDRDTDTNALLLLSSTRGLLTVDRAAYATAAHGAITVTGEAGAWHVTLRLEAAVTGLLAQYVGAQLRAEVKHLATDKLPLWVGFATLERGIVQGV